MKGGSTAFKAVFAVVRWQFKPDFAVLQIVLTTAL